MSGCRLVLALTVVAACARGSSSTSDGAAVDTMAAPRDAAIDGNGCATQPCSILPQCGCNGATACDYDGNDDSGTACRSVLDQGTETSTCTQATACDRGFVCVGGASFASCKKYCNTDVDCGAPRGQCVYTLTANGAPIADVPKICSSNCDPTDASGAGCPATFKCTLYTFNDGGTSKKIADCSPAGTGIQGASCTSATNGPNEALCAKGYQCVNLNTDGVGVYRCRRICSPPTSGASASCPNAQRCLTFNPPHVIGGTDYGICLP